MIFLYINDYVSTVQFVVSVYWCCTFLTSFILLLVIFIWNRLNHLNERKEESDFRLHSICNTLTNWTFSENPAYSSTSFETTTEDNIEYTELDYERVYDIPI